MAAVTPAKPGTNYSDASSVSIDENSEFVIGPLVRSGLPGERREAVFYRRTLQHESRRRLISRRDIAEAAIEGLMASAAAITPASTCAALCRHLSVLTNPPGGRDRLPPFAAALRAVLGPISDSDARSVFRRWWESLYRRRMILVRELIGRARPQILLTGREHLEVAAASGRGAIMWTADFMPQSLIGKRGLCEAGFRVNQIASRYHGFRNTWFGNACLNRIQVRAENRYLAARLMFGMQEETGTLLLDAVALLRKGAFVSFANNNFAGRSFIEMPLGPSGFVSMPTTPVALALRLGIPLFYVSTIECEPLMKYELRVTEILAADQRSRKPPPAGQLDYDAIARITRKARDELLKDLRKAPYQFLNWPPLSRSVLLEHD